MHVRTGKTHQIPPEYICMQPIWWNSQNKKNNFYTNKQNVSKLTTEFYELVGELENFQLINGIIRRNFGFATGDLIDSVYCSPSWLLFFLLLDFFFFFLFFSLFCCCCCPLTLGSSFTKNHKTIPIRSICLSLDRHGYFSICFRETLLCSSLSLRIWLLRVSRCFMYGCCYV